MAADILLYQTDLVPVGLDQKQHLELSRDIAVRFNGLYGNTFRIPDAYIPKTSAKIMSLADPTKKMSKSDENVKATIFLLDSKDSIIKKFKSAVTDSEMEVVYREGKDGINNLMSIYSAITKKSYEEIQREFEGKGYGDFKTAVGETVAEELRPIREEYDRLMADKAYLESCYRDGAQKARTISQRTLDKVYKKIGFLPASLQFACKEYTMTEKLFDLDSYCTRFSASVLSCEPASKNGMQGFAVKLDRTCFFPEGGGHSLRMARISRRKKS